MKKPPLHKSFYFTFKGLFWLIKNERNFQIHIFGLIINIFLMIYFKLEVWEIITILCVSFSVLITEAVNTCIEKICDYIQPNFDNKIGIIKDIAGGAVLLATMLAVITGVLIYWKYLF